MPVYLFCSSTNAGILQCLAHLNQASRASFASSMVSLWKTRRKDSLSLYARYNRGSVFAIHSTLACWLGVILSILVFTFTALSLTLHIIWLLPIRNTVNTRLFEAYKSEKKLIYHITTKAKWSMKIEYGSCGEYFPGDRWAYRYTRTGGVCYT